MANFRMEAGELQDEPVALAVLKTNKCSKFKNIGHARDTSLTWCYLKGS